jgi:hypothetical protein
MIFGKFAIAFFVFFGVVASRLVEKRQAAVAIPPIATPIHQCVHAILRLGPIASGFVVIFEELQVSQNLGHRLLIFLGLG